MGFRINSMNFVDYIRIRRFGKIVQGNMPGGEDPNLSKRTTIK